MSLKRYRKSLKKLWRRLQRYLLGGRRILVLGDSHCGIFEYCFDHGMLVPHWLNCDIVGGATAYGLNNDASVTQAWQKFDHALRRFASYDVVVIMLGECDCSFALWKKAQHLNVPPESLIEHSLAGIRRLVLKIRNAPKSNVRTIILAGAILPTVDDLSTPIQDNELRREVGASQAQRTALVLAFNEKLEQQAATLDIPYFDLTAQIIDRETGLIDQRFVGRADDHHLSFPAGAQLYCSALLRLL
jgi:lysophospholipase L1-like esterase